MAKPHIHARSSAKIFGGLPDDYINIHEFMDCSKQTIGDNRHRALTHNYWFVANVLVRVFGNTFINSDGKVVSTRDIGEQHCFEDLGCVPPASDYLTELEYKPWMSGKGRPPSQRKLISITEGKRIQEAKID